MLDYVALGFLIFAAITLFYGIIVIHDIPYEIAVHRNHPHQDAIHVAGWVSLFTIGAIWPFLWIWSMLYREDRGWGFDGGRAPPDDDESATAIGANAIASARDGSAPNPDVAAAVTLLQHKMEALDERIARIEQAILAAGDESDGAN